MEDVTLDYAKKHLDELVRRAAAGEEVRISDATLGTVKLGPVAVDLFPSQIERRPGRWKGRLNIPDDKLLEPMSEEDIALWYGTEA